MSNFNLAENSLKNIKKSSIFDHLLQCDCLIDFNHFDILPTGINKIRLFVKENLFIRRDKQILNRAIKSFPPNYLSNYNKKVFKFASVSSGRHKIVKKKFCHK